MTETAERENVKILFVDDEENILKAVTRLLLDEPFTVLTATSGNEGVKLLREHPDIAVIVSDQRMPEMEGTEFLAQAKTLLPDSTRILLTGYADIAAVIDAINRGGAYRYLSKPWKDGELIQALRDGVQRHALIAENKRLTAVIGRQNEELKQWSSQLELMVQEQTLDLQKRGKELERLNEQLRINFSKTIEAFSGLIEMRDRSVSSHSRSVADLARRTAAAMNLPDEEQNRVFIAALLHDIGKIGIPDAALIKGTEGMNVADRREYELHPVRGQVVVEGIEGLAEAGLMIRHHHEHLDGSGFPDHLSRNNIPLGSRILCVADAADRIANRGAVPDYPKAASEIEFLLDARYDRQVFRAMQPLLLERAREAVTHAAAAEVEVFAPQLRSGMVLARDVRSGTGVLLLGRGMVLDERSIEGLRRFFAMDPSKAGIFVRK